MDLCAIMATATAWCSLGAFGLRLTDLRHTAVSLRIHKVGFPVRRSIVEALVNGHNVKLLSHLGKPLHGGLHSVGIKFVLKGDVTIRVIGTSVASRNPFFKISVDFRWRMTRSYLPIERILFPQDGSHTHLMCDSAYTIIDVSKRLKINPVAKSEMKENTSCMSYRSYSATHRSPISCKE